MCIFILHFVLGIFDINYLEYDAYGNVYYSKAGLFQNDSFVCSTSVIEHHSHVQCQVLSHMLEIQW